MMHHDGTFVHILWFLFANASKNAHEQVQDLLGVLAFPSAPFSVAKARQGL